MGRAGAPRAVPDVEWNDDGTWRILTEIPRRRSEPLLSDDAVARQVKALEGEIKQLERNKHNPAGRLGMTAFGDREWLRELKRKLARIDPTNPWSTD